MKTNPPNPPFEGGLAGKFIVIDGADGSGKATQTELLAKRLVRAGFNVKTVDFPQYNTKSAGLIEEYLNGKYGSAKQVGPYRASIFYACDRYSASLNIKRWLEQGKIVIANRYVTANLAHQGGKIQNPLERKHFFDWLNQLEYEIFEIPKPDLNIILHLPAAISQALIRNRQFKLGQPLDIHEDDLDHLRQAEQIYLEIARTFSGMVLIECVRQGRLLNIETIEKLIWREVEKIITRAPQSSGLDLYSSDYYSLLPGRGSVIRALAKPNIPKGYSGAVVDRLGLKKNGIHIMSGLFDRAAAGVISIFLINLSQDIYHIAPGQKIAQLLIQKVEAPEIIEGRLSDNTDRQNRGFGSSGLF